MQDIKLSASAVASLRFRVKGWHFPVREPDLPGYRELVNAGIMEPDGERDFRFTRAGMEHGEAILGREADRIERERYEPPDVSGLSDDARELLRACVVGACPEGDESNRPAYRELVAARIMIPVGSFTKGDECVFKWTYWGWRMRFELAGVDYAVREA